MITILNEQQQFDVTPVGVTDTGLWLAREDVTRATGFELKPEGLCKGAICVPLPRDGTPLVDSQVGSTLPPSGGTWATRRA